MRWTLGLWLALASILPAGCTNNRAELIEAELRTREKQLRALQADLQRSEMMNYALETSLREQRAMQPILKPGGAMALVKDIQIGRGTGGLDEDKYPGDEGLQVVVVPRDSDETAIKAPGCLRIIAFEITNEGLKVPLSTWDISAQHVRRSWRSGFLATGYFVSIPWQKTPSFERLRVVAQFYPLEGGVFEAEKDVTVRLFPSPASPSLSAPAMGPGYVVPGIPLTPTEVPSLAPPVVNPPSIAAPSLPTPPPPPAPSTPATSKTEPPTAPKPKEAPSVPPKDSPPPPKIPDSPLSGPIMAPPDPISPDKWRPVSPATADLGPPLTFPR